jgi:hypothetical protein
MLSTNPGTESAAGPPVADAPENGVDPPLADSVSVPDLRAGTETESRDGEQSTVQTTVEEIDDDAEEGETESGSNPSPDAGIESDDKEIF